jgi:cation/acetate symporter
VLALGIFWKRANKWGAVSAMIGGLGVTFYYMVTTQPWLYKTFHGVAITPDVLKANIWWDIQPISAGLFGVPVGFALLIIVSLLTKPPGKEVQELVEYVRYPSLDGKTSSGTAGHETV